MNSADTAKNQVIILMDMVNELGLETVRRGWLQVKPEGTASYAISINRMTKQQCDKVTELASTYIYGNEKFRCILNGTRDSASLWVFPRDEKDRNNTEPKIKIEIEGWLERSTNFRDEPEEGDE